MAAAQPITTDSRVTRRLFSLDAPAKMAARTGAEDRVEHSSPFAAKLPRATEVAPGEPKRLWSDRAEKAEPATAPRAEPVRRLEAVVGEIMRDSVILHCAVPSGTIDIRLPPELIPAELRQYGQPVCVSLRSEKGFRFPIIERREIAPQPELPGQAEIDAWIDSL